MEMGGSLYSFLSCVCFKCFHSRSSKPTNMDYPCSTGVLTSLSEQRVGTIFFMAGGIASSPAGGSWPGPRPPVLTSLQPSRASMCLGDMPVEVSLAYLQLMDQLGGLFRRLKFLGHPREWVGRRRVLPRAGVFTAQQHLLHDLGGRLEDQWPAGVPRLLAAAPGLGRVVTLIFGESHPGSHLGEVRERVVQPPPAVLGGVRR